MLCKACGEKGHIVWSCDKLKQHTEEIKKAIGYNGDPKWLMDDAHSKKCIALFKSRQWFAVSVHAPMQYPKDGAAVAGHDNSGPLQKGQLPYKLEKDWTDAGWCWLGWGKAPWGPDDGAWGAPGAP